MKRPDIPLLKCDNCEGTGNMPGTKTGVILRREREERRVPRIVKRKKNCKQGLAYHFFGFSESYILDLERGRRPWTWALVEKYREAIEKAAALRKSNVEDENEDESDDEMELPE